MNINSLLTFFTEHENDTFVSSHSEKGPYEDYYEGKTIPVQLVKQFNLYKFTLSPILNLKYKVDHPLVVIKGGVKMNYNGWMFLVYHVGIGLDAQELPENEGVDTRVLILNPQQEFYNNLFIGGKVRRGDRQEEVVSREMHLSEEGVKMRLLEAYSEYVPSFLRILDEEIYPLED